MEKRTGKEVLLDIMNAVGSVPIPADMNTMIVVVVTDPEKFHIQTNSTGNIEKDENDNIKRLIANHLMGGQVFPLKKLDEIKNLDQ